jgi:hypothetical protein
MNLPAKIPLNSVAVRQMTAEGQSDKMASDMEVRMKQRCVIEFLNPERIAPNNIHRTCFLAETPCVIMMCLLTAVGLSPGGSTHLHTNNTQNNTNNNRTTQITNNVQECGP